MKKLFIIIACIIACVGFFVSTRPVFACGTPACTRVYVRDCQTVSNPGYPDSQKCTDSWVCSVQTPQGTCMCCQDDSCMFNCGGPTPGPGGGSGGGGGGGGAAYCGDGTCNNGETCDTCPTDCGECTGTVKVRAIQVPSSAGSCPITSTNYINVNMTVFPPGQSQNTPTDGTYATFVSQLITAPYTTYGFDVLTPGSYVYKLACWTRDSPATSGTGATADLYTDSTLTWDVGFTNGAPWVQSQGGDVYAATNVQSYVGTGATPRYFDTNGSGGTPGIVTYGSSYLFDTTPGSKGANYVSPKGWLVNETQAATDYYAVMYHRFGDPKADNTGSLSVATLAQLLPSPNSQVVYYNNGAVSIDGSPWVVGSGQSLVLFVNGNLTINEPITITPGGFVAFVVNGDISVNTSVGSAYTSSMPDLQGIFMTSPTGTFHSGLSTTAAARRLVIKGTVITGNFDLTRDLDADAANNTTSAELFIYDPQLLLTMPQQMEDLPIYWQEVAP